MIMCSPVTPVLGRGAETGKSLCLAGLQAQCEALSQRNMSKSDEQDIQHPSLVSTLILTRVHTHKHAHKTHTNTHTQIKTAAMQIKSYVFFSNYEIDTKK